MTKATGQGTWLGLSLAYVIIKAPRDSLLVKSFYIEPGELNVVRRAQEGSEFVIQLPM